MRDEEEDGPPPRQFREAGHGDSDPSPPVDIDDFFSGEDDFQTLSPLGGGGGGKEEERVHQDVGLVDYFADGYGGDLLGQFPLQDAAEEEENTPGQHQFTYETPSFRPPVSLGSGSTRQHEKQRYVFSQRPRYEEEQVVLGAIEGGGEGGGPFGDNFQSFLGGAGQGAFESDLRNFGDVAGGRGEAEPTLRDFSAGYRQHFQEPRARKRVKKYSVKDEESISSGFDDSFDGSYDGGLGFKENRDFISGNLDATGGFSNFGGGGGDSGGANYYNRDDGDYRSLLGSSLQQLDLLSPYTEQQLPGDDDEEDETGSFWDRPFQPQDEPVAQSPPPSWPQERRIRRKLRRRQPQGQGLLQQSHPFTSAKHLSAFADADFVESPWPPVGIGQKIALGLGREESDSDDGRAGYEPPPYHGSGRYHRHSS